MPRDTERESRRESGHSDGLGDVALANAGITEQQSVFVLLDEAAVSQLEDERSVERVELPIEGIECSLVAKAGSFDAPFDQPITPPLQLVVNEQADKVQWSQAVGSGLLRSDGERIGHTA